MLEGGRFMKTFLILTDLDSTFEEWEEGRGEFETFDIFVNKFESKFGVKVKIHFISGTNKDDLEKRFNFFKTKYPEIYSRIGYAILSGGKKYNKSVNQIGICDTDKAVYSKADGVQDVLSEYGKYDVAGVCYMGDDTTDIAAFETVKWCKSQFNLGAYALAPRSRRAYEQIKSHIDFYSDKPRVLGCVENLVNMAKEISKKKENIK